MINKYFTDSQDILFYHCGDNQEWKSQSSFIWEENELEGRKIFFCKNKPFTRIFLGLIKQTSVNKIYQFDIRFRLKTKSRSVRFMFSNDNSLKSSDWYTFWQGNIPNDRWTRIQGRFCSMRNDSKYFMLASTDFTGIGAYITFDWIMIREVTE